METHVVTLSPNFSDGRTPAGFICEVFRGEEQECRELAIRIPAGSHDMRQIAESTTQWGRNED